MTTSTKTTGPTLSKSRAVFTTAVRIGNEDGKAMGTSKVVFDLPFIESLKGSWIFVHWNDAPAEKGWYRIDRESRTFKKISQVEASTLNWHDKLCVEESALHAAKGGKPLSLCVDFYNEGDGLLLVAGFPDGFGRVAQAERGHEAAAPQ
jgi:hypothetical protein